MNDIEAIEILKSYLKYPEMDDIEIMKEAIENLLKERQSDKEKIKDLEEAVDQIYEDYQYLGKEKWKSDEAVIFLTKRLENSIPKSLIKEKIEEYKAKTDCRYCNNSCDSYAVCKVLEELLNKNVK